MDKKKKETYLVPIILVIISFLISFFTNNFTFGFITLSSGLLNGWYATIGKWYNYVFGIVFNLINAYVCFVSGLYGIFIFSLVIYVPLQIVGLFSWYLKKEDDNTVKRRSFNGKKKGLIPVACFLISTILGYALSKLPSSNLAFLDAMSNTLNIGAFILMNLRYNECWIIMLGNNVVDLVIWILNFILNTPNSFVMLLVSSAYLVLNLVALDKWKLKKTVV